MAKKWIQEMHMKKNALHEALDVPAGKKIPASKLTKAEHSKNPTLAKRARLAETLKSFKKKMNQQKDKEFYKYLKQYFLKISEYFAILEMYGSKNREE